MGARTDPLACFALDARSYRAFLPQLFRRDSLLETGNGEEALPGGVACRAVDEGRFLADGLDEGALPLALL